MEKKQRKFKAHYRITKHGFKFIVFINEVDTDHGMRKIITVKNLSYPTIHQVVDKRRCYDCDDRNHTGKIKQFIGLATCNPADKFNLNKGVEIAMWRCIAQIMGSLMVDHDRFRQASLKLFNPLNIEHERQEAKKKAAPPIRARKRQEAEKKMAVNKTEIRLPTKIKMSEGLKKKLTKRAVKK